MSLLFVLFYTNAGLTLLILGLAIWEVLLTRRLKENKSEEVCFIIPAYESQKYINQCIDAIYRQDYPKEKISIIVYASGNTKGYDFKKYKGKNFLFLKGRGKVEKALAVNRAIKRCKEDFVFIVDSDTLLREDSLKKAISRFSSEEVGAVTISRAARGKGFWTLLQNAEYIMTSFILSSYSRLGSSVGLFGCSMMFRKKAFQDIGGLRRIPAQDFDAALRLIEKDWKVYCILDSAAYTTAPGIRKWIKQRFRWMRGFSLSILNHYKVFFTKPFGLAFTLIYSILALVFLFSFFLNSGFWQSVISILIFIISFNVPLLGALGIFTGVLGWALYDRIILVILYSCLSLPYLLYPYRLRDMWKSLFIVAYSLVYLPIFTITGIVGVVWAISDKIRGREVIKW